MLTLKHLLLWQFNKIIGIQKPDCNNINKHGMMYMPVTAASMVSRGRQGGILITGIPMPVDNHDASTARSYLQLMVST